MIVEILGGNGINKLYFVVLIDYDYIKIKNYGAI